MTIPSKHLFRNEEIILILSFYLVFMWFLKHDAAYLKVLTMLMEIARRLLI